MTWPSVTVIMPAYNRPAQARACLEGIAALDYPRALLGVSIVDDGSAVPLAPLLDGHDWPFALTVTRQANQGPAEARNAAVAQATGALLAFIDDDCLPHPGWVRALVAAHRAHPAALIGGHVTNDLPDDRYAGASQDLIDFLHAHFDARGGAQFFTSNNMACGRDDFLAAGGFDTRFDRAAGEDREFGLRWRRQGRPLIHAPDAIVSHRHHLDLAGFWRQHRQYGAAAHRFHGMMRQDDIAAPTFEGLSFYLGLIAHPLRRYGVAGVPRAMLMALSQMAMVHGYVDAMRGR